MKRFAFLPLFALLALNACDDDDDPTGNENQARIRIVNASPGNTSVNVFLDNQQEVGGVGFGTASACPGAEIPAGQRTLQFRATGSQTTLRDVPFNFQANQSYTVVLYGSGGTLNGAVFQESPVTTPSAGNHAFRIINATTGVADVYVTPPGAAIGTVDIDALAAGTATTNAVYRQFPEAETRVRFTDDGSTTVRADITLDDDPNVGATTFVYHETTTGRAAIQVNPCT